MHENEKTPHVEPQDNGETSAAFDPLHEMEPVPESGYEVRDFLGRRQLMRFGFMHFVGLTVVLLLTAGLHRVFVAWAKSPPPASPLVTQRKEDLPAAPLQSEPLRDLEQLRSRQRIPLDTYGWVDRQAGRAHIPIERAIDRVASKGLPYRAKGDGVESP